MIQLESPVVGAWLLHHDQKLSAVRSRDFPNITLAGRAARLLSVMSREFEWTLSLERVQELGRANDISKHEIPGLLEELTRLGLVDRSANGVAVLGVTQTSLVKHASTIFEAQKPDGIELAAIELSERASHIPLTRADCEGAIADQYKLSRLETDDLFMLSERIGFVDYEQAGTERLYFNGTLFRRDQAQKTKFLLEGLSSDERSRLSSASEQMDRLGCVQKSTLVNLLGELLWSKLHQIGMFEVSYVVNENGPTPFVTKPSSLSKFVPGGLADMLNDAKALASSLMYGILKSSRARGQIMQPAALTDALINRGYVEGRVAAIKHDYHFLEERGVVQVSETSNGNRLTLLKSEIGRMAADLILLGDASSTAMQVTVGNQAPTYSGPEQTRRAERLRSIPGATSGVARAIDILRRTQR